MRVSSLLLVPLCASTALSTQSAATYLQYATKAAQTMVTDYYHGGSGFGGLDWNSAWTLRGLISLQHQAPNATSPTVLEIIEDMYNNPVTPGWLDQWYDDQGWWTLAWLSAFQLTGNRKYFDVAESIFSNTVLGWNAKCGGIWEKKDHTEENALPNAAFLSSATLLAMYTTSSANKTEYLAWAEKEWLWLSNSGILNTSPGPIAGGYDYTTCTAGDNAVGGNSALQGEMVRALLLYSKVAPSQYKAALLSNATGIATGTINSATYNQNGIFHEPVGPDFTSVTAQRKGIFFSGLAYLQNLYPSTAYVDFATKNADSLWSVAQQKNGTFGPNWDSSVDDFEDRTQTAAMSSAMLAFIYTAAMVAGASK